ncbi:MAG: C40 family peptidase [Dorea sp.]
MNFQRVAQDQSQYGTQIPVEDAQPGDLIFYAKAGHVYHVVMYAGDGKTIEAANTKAGIISGTVNTENAVWATRILEDNEAVVDGGHWRSQCNDRQYVWYMSWEF